jgi:STE24 endopeptidase
MAGTQLTVLVLGLALLAVLTVRWVPPVAVPPVDDDAVALDFSRTERERAEDFRRRVRPWGLVGVALGVLVPTLLVVSGAAEELVGSAPGGWSGSVVVVTTGVLGLTRLVTVPGAVAVRRVSLRAGLATGPWRRWWRDLVVAFLFSWMLSVLALLGWVGAARVWPQAWWTVVAAAAAVLAVLGSFILPVLVEPLFARHTPMPPSPLRDRVLDLASRDGVVVRRVLVADASRRTTTLNAYVSGLGATRRVVVHDTLLDRDADGEVAAVVAHELGHVVAHDVRTGTTLGAVAAAVSVAAAALALAWPPLRDVTHVTGAADPGAAAVLLALGAWAALLTAPVQNAVSRRMERRADQHCLDLAQDAATVAGMHRALAVANLAPLRPPRLLHLWFGTHPTAVERIAAAREWARAHDRAVPAPLAPDPARS